MGSSTISNIGQKNMKIHKMDQKYNNNNNINNLVPLKKEASKN